MKPLFDKESFEASVSGKPFGSARPASIVKVELGKLNEPTVTVSLSPGSRVLGVVERSLRNAIHTPADRHQVIGPAPVHHDGFHHRPLPRKRLA